MPLPDSSTGRAENTPISTKVQTETHRLEDSPRGVHEPAQQTPVANSRQAGSRNSLRKLLLHCTLVTTYCAITWTMSRTSRRDRTGYHRASLAGTRSEAQSNVARLANYFCLGAVSKVTEFISQLSDSTEFVGFGVALVVTLGTSITCVAQEVGSIGSVHHDRSPVSGDRQVRRR